MIKDILPLLDRDFDLLYTCEVSKFDQVFHSDAALQTVGPNGYVQLSAAQYKDLLSKRASPLSQGAARKDDVLTVDQSSPTTAFAKTRAEINGTAYCDYLSLLKLDGGWRIAAKVYCIVPK